MPFVKPKDPEVKLIFVDMTARSSACDGDGMDFVECHQVVYEGVKLNIWNVNQSVRQIPNFYRDTEICVIKRSRDGGGSNNHNNNANHSNSSEAKSSRSSLNSYVETFDSLCKRASKYIVTTRGSAEGVAVDGYEVVAVSRDTFDSGDMRTLMRSVFPAEFLREFRKPPKLELNSDRMCTRNTTQCYERNGI